MRQIPVRYFAAAISALLGHGGKMKSATVFVDERTRVTATFVHRSDTRRGARHTTVAVTFGAPNYAGREFIRTCREVGEPFPVKKPQLRPWPVPRKSKTGKRRR